MISETGCVLPPPAQRRWYSYLHEQLGFLLPQNPSPDPIQIQRYAPPLSLTEFALLNIASFPLQFLTHSRFRLL